VLNPLARYPEMQRLHESSEYRSEYRDKARELLLTLKTHARTSAIEERMVQGPCPLGACPR
jgi:hypothetical protein